MCSIKPFHFEAIYIQKKCEGRSIDMTFESNVLLLTNLKELLQPSCFEPYSIWQNLMDVCWLKNVQMTLLDDKLKVTLKSVFLLPVYNNNFIICIIDIRLSIIHSIMHENWLWWWPNSKNVSSWYCDVNVSWGRTTLLEKRCYSNTFRGASSMVYIRHPRVYKFWHTRGAALAPNGC